MFKDRKDAGKKLASVLAGYKNKNVLVLAIPRGGVEVGLEVARYLKADFDILISRKLPIPSNPEAGFGAIAEDGSVYINKGSSLWVSKDEIEIIKKEQIEEIKRRISVLRGGRPLKSIRNREVILIDDGLAMGSTMKVSIKMCRNQNAKKIIVAVPVSGVATFNEIKEIADEIYALEKPYNFKAVAQVYLNWYDVTDEEVLEMMEKENLKY
ncbi:MAG: phosphoribosyltransferase [Actinobacteria bacterium]|nr:phosphoribosyltransferase [Actinomycetota bacterium]MCL5070134.1 phosphoribosyltransferase [Actinomycetota bacterium]